MIGDKAKDAIRRYRDMNQRDAEALIDEDDRLHAGLEAAAWKAALDDLEALQTAFAKETAEIAHQNSCIFLLRNALGKKRRELDEALALNLVQTTEIEDLKAKLEKACRDR